MSRTEKARNTPHALDCPCRPCQGRRRRQGPTGMAAGRGREAGPPPSGAQNGTQALDESISVGAGVALDQDLMPPRAPTIMNGVAAQAAPTIMDVISQDFPAFLEPSWAAWRVWLRALFALEPEPGDLEVYRAHTERQDWPTSALREAWAILGRRGGKTAIASLVAVYLSCYRDYRAQLQPGEVAVLPIIAADRHQAQVAFRYVLGMIESRPHLKRMIARKTKEIIELRNRVVIEVHTSSYRSTRGFTLCGVLADESAFWWTEETAANPDVEVLNALRPGLLTLRGPMVCCTTPYARKGAAWTAYRTHYGQAGARALIWGGDSRSMNPNLPEADIEAAYDADPQAASAEYGGLFRADLASFISEELLQRCVVLGRGELPPLHGVKFVAFVDPSGGSQDSYTLGIAHEDRARHIVMLDRVVEVQPPFSPDAVTQGFATICTEYGIKEVVGDRYGGEFPRELFRKAGISYRVSEQTKSELYLAALPLMTSGRVELLEHKRLLAQLRGLERRTGSTGKDTVDHGPRGHDDLSNAAMGAITLVQLAGKSWDPFTWSHTKNTHLGSRGGQYRDPRVSDQPITYRRSDRGDERIEDDPAAHDINNETHRFECGICRAKWKAQ